MQHKDVLVNIPGNVTADSLFIANHINQQFAAVAQGRPCLDPTLLPAYMPCRAPPPEVFPWDVYNILRKLKVGKAPGPDQLSSRVLREFACEFSTPLADILNASLKEGYVPQQWKDAIVVPLPKSQPPSISKLRPVSLTSQLAKVAETFVSKWLLRDIRPSLDPQQYGSLKGRSTAQYLVSLLDYVTKESDKLGNITTMVMTDFSKAFDRIDHTSELDTFSDWAKLNHMLLNAEKCHYMYIEASSPRQQGDIARLVSPTYLLHSGSQCLLFWTHMYGLQTGTLRVSVNAGNTTTEIWSRSGNQGNQWFSVAVSIPVTGSYQVIYEVVRGSGDQGDIAIDDVSILQEPCPEANANTSLSWFDFYDEKELDGNTFDQIPDISVEECALRCLVGTDAVWSGLCQSFEYDHQDGACVLSRANKDTPGAILSDSDPRSRYDYYHRRDSPYSCDFEANLCRYTQDTTDDFQWTRNSGRTRYSSTGPTGDHTTGSGYYIYIDSTYPRQQGDIARLISPTYRLYRGSQCLLFWTHMYGSSTGTLRVSVKAGGTTTEIWSRSGNQGNQWFSVAVSIPVTGSYQVIFEGVRGGNAHGDITIDDVSILQGACPDVDECVRREGRGSCDQICTNTVGGFYCSCYTGFTLQQDNLTCNEARTSWFDFYDEKVLSGHNTERIEGIHLEECAGRCLVGTSTVPSGSCLSFDYDHQGGGACVLSTANKDTSGAVLSDSDPPERFDYYHKRDSPYSCAFETANLCQYTQDTTDDFQWTRHSGLTGSSNTGPTGDHTTGSSSGTLRVSVKAGDTTTEIWSLRSGNQGNQWFSVNVSIPVTGSYQVIFEGVRGSGAYGDIVIDDVSILQEACPGRQTELKSSHKGKSTCVHMLHLVVSLVAISGVQCPALAVPDNGVLNGGNSYQDVVQFTCNHGYQLIGESSRTCQADGTWTGAAPTCIGVQCSTLTAPENGAVNGGNSYQNVVQFTCYHGYQLIGDSSRTCQADGTWTGANPACIDIDSCSPNPCVTRAQCTDVIAPGTGFRCTCGTGYVGDGLKSGTGCTDSNGCSPNPCVSQASCADVSAPGTGATCTCGTGYEGDGRQDGSGCSDIDGCLPNPCVTQASCADVIAPGTGATCTCRAGYVGDGRNDGTGCTDNNGCSSNPCVALASCTDVPAPGAGAICTCGTGYEGDGRHDGIGCSDINGCSPNPCVAQASCADVSAPGTGAICTCGTEYEGDGRKDGTGCSDINGCSPNPCVSRACCADVPAPGTGATCTCGTGYDGDGRQDGTGCSDIDGCLPNPCVTQASCADVIAPGTGATCTCRAGYVGDGRNDGTGCTDNNGCSSNPCVALASCTDVPAPGAGAICTCGTGYEGDGRRDGTGCSDINGCSPNPCVAQARCTDVPASGTGATCTCGTGYVGDARKDGTGCSDIDGCLPNPCVTQASCADVIAPGTGATCTCRAGYVGDGRNDGTGCTDNNGCSSNPCVALASCTDVPAPGAGAICTCGTGYEGDGRRDGTGCSDINGCSPNPCVAQSSCADVPASGTGAICTCGTGYVGDGRKDGSGCLDINGCSPNPCVTQASCADVPAPGTGATCTCGAGYDGDGRQDGTGCSDIDSCLPNPCVTQASCADVIAPGTGATCTCRAGYVGDGRNDGTGCTDNNGCSPNPCVALASCTDVPAPGTGAICTCGTGYEGDGRRDGTGCSAHVLA
ncbi:uncharacterized protein LOC118432292 [Branchiostoma floridae]|uniref:Uncharacterized protein LOC118432292 n=1 Tax=Branchiostoma floridae TaxID=7739 RepID=A0A9J7NDN7_BRAFL|nr:uncharacterized protein LOC118432292 [Branchiostoma floridae]